MDIIETMLVRKSVRTYDGRPLPDQMLQELLDRFNTNDRLNDLPLRLEIFPADQVAHATTGLIGSYGSMRNPPHYAIGISAHGPGDQINFGFALEQFVLDCAINGIGTCWIGGFFKLSQLNEVVPQNENERIICITPVGYGAPRRFGEKLMRTSGGLNRRKPMGERVFYRRWGRPADDYLQTNSDLHKIFECARWAPSASNLQPSHFVVDEKRIIITILTSLHRKKLYSLIKDRAEDLNFQQVDGGISMAHVHLGAKALGISGKWSLEFKEQELRQKYAIVPAAKILGVFEFD